METAVKQRIKVLLEAKKATLNSIANGDTALKMALSRQVNGTTAISQVTISLLLSKFPDLSAEWLLRGAGDMLISSVVPTERTPRDDRENTETTTATTRQRHGNEPMDNATLTAALEQIEQLQTELAQQKEFNALQREYVADLKERIAEYQERISELKEIIHELKKAQHAATVPHAKNA